MLDCQINVKQNKNIRILKMTNNKIFYFIFEPVYGCNKSCSTTDYHALRGIPIRIHCIPIGYDFLDYIIY